MAAFSRAIRLPTRPRTTEGPVTPPPALLLPLLMAMVMPLQTAGQSGSVAYVPSLGRSVQGHSPYGPGQVQQIVHVPDTTRFVQNVPGVSDLHADGFDSSRVAFGNTFATGAGFGSGGSSSYGSNPRSGAITISIPHGATITIGPSFDAGFGSNTRFDASAGPHANQDTQTAANLGTGFSKTSGSEFRNHGTTGDAALIANNRNGLGNSYNRGSNPSPDPSFNTVPGLNDKLDFIAGSHSSSNFAEESDRFAKVVSGSGSSSVLTDPSNPTSDFAAVLNPKSGITPSPDVILSLDQDLHHVGRPDSSSGFGTGPGPDFNIGHITSSFKQFGTNLNRIARVGGKPGINASPDAATASGSSTNPGAGSNRPTSPGSRSRASGKQTAITRFNSTFGTGPGHARRKTCTRTVDLNAEYDLRLIPYDIPVEGQGLPSTGCRRDEVRQDTLDGPCVKVLAQGTCSDEHWVLFDNTTNVGTCQERLCPAGSAFVEATGFCHDLFQADFCPGDRLIQVTASGESVCACDDGWYPDRCGFCQLVFSQAGCPSGLAHQFNTDAELRCLPTTGCPRGQPVPLPEGRGCSNFGAPCRRPNGLPGVWGFLTDSLEVSCISEGATTSRRRRDLGPRAGTSDGSSVARFRRSVFGGSNMVNSCQPGARSDFNAACRSAAVPSRNRRAVSTRAPTCPRGTAMINGRCSRSGDDLGK